MPPTPQKIYEDTSNISPILSSIDSMFSYLIRSCWLEQLSVLDIDVAPYAVLYRHIADHRKDIPKHIDLETLLEQLLDRKFVP